MSDLNIRIGQSDAIKVLTTSSSKSSRNVIGGIASVSQLLVTGISTLGGVEVQSGFITAASGVGLVTYYGDGSYLTGVTGSVVGDLTELNVTGITTVSGIKIQAGIITGVSGVVTFTGDVADLDGGAF